MNIKTLKFLKILKIELEDLIIDLEFSEQVLAKRLHEQEITEYVFLENISLLKKEILGIENVKKYVQSAGTADMSIDELKELLETYFGKEIKAAGLPNVVLLLVNRKLDKVSKYMTIGG